MRATFVKNAKTGINVMDWEVVASGYAAVWATENTREVDLGRDAAQGNLRHHRPADGRALLRRLGLRAGRRHNRAARRRSAIPRACRWAAICAQRREGKAPTFLVAALKDPIGANLDRYQIVKGWLDAKGNSRRRSMTWRGAATASPAPTASSRRSATPSTLPNATWTNTIGAPELIAVWNDPDFDPAEHAFYYGRVIEIPTPRWTAYDAKCFGITTCRRKSR